MTPEFHGGRRCLTDSPFPCPPLLLVLFALAAPLLRAADDYPPGPDSKVQPGVPQGELIKFGFSGSKIFPGTTREVTVIAGGITGNDLVVAHNGNIYVTNPPGGASNDPSKGPIRWGQSAGRWSTATHARRGRWRP